MDKNRKYYEKQNKKRKQAMLIKTMVCLAGILILAFIASTYRNYKVKEGKAPYVKVEEILPVLEAFSIVNNSNAYTSMTADADYFSQEYATVKDVKGILEYFSGIDTSILEEYKKDSWYMGNADWNQLLMGFVQQYGGGEIIATELTLYGDESNVSNENGNPLQAGSVLTDRGVMETVFWNTDMYLYNNIVAVCYGDRLLSIVGRGEERTLLRNVYLADASAEEVHFFKDHYHIRYETKAEGETPGEKASVIDWDMKEAAGGMLVDLQFGQGGVTVVEKDVEYVHGKLLQVSDEGIEIEGYGIFKPDEEMEIYRLYSELTTQDKKDLRIGYSFTDFVLEDGKIAACLMVKEEDMEYIRVLLKSSDYAGRYHDSFAAKCDQDYEVIYYRNGIEEKREEKAKGDSFAIEAGDLEAGVERIKLLPKVLSAKTTIESIVRSQGVPSYSGSIEITAEEDGLLLVNEVLLEDYLCKVVPSEMPSSYPKEALMAQAVCARTYAYGKMLKSGLPTLGAHVDDSAGFQVYNNIKEQGTTTEAVKATHNKIAQYQGTPIGAYYYSTSCGVGSDASVWHGSGENPAYLVPQVIAFETVSEIAQGSEGSVSENSVDEILVKDGPTASDLASEEVFRDWIMDQDDTHYESKEGWYRWTYTVEELHTEYMEEVLQKRYESNSKLILTQNAEGEFESQPIPSLGKIKDISITKRLPGGVADELMITGSEATIKVLSELNIRYVLSDGVTKVLRQSGDEVNASSTLPSAFCILDLEMEEDVVTGYRVTGGGFGHGVGMSQNGARNMAQAGKSCEEILTFFYPGIEIKTLQFEE